MPRHFDRTANDVITVGPGAIPPGIGDVSLGVTWAIIWFPEASNEYGLFSLELADTTKILSVNPFTDNNVYSFLQGAGSGASETNTGWISAEWQLHAWTKAATSSTNNARWHRYRYSNSTWTHENDGTAQAFASNFTALGHLHIGRYDTGNDLTGEIAVLAVWDRVLSDGEVEGLALDIQGWYNAAPKAGWILNQTSTAQPVPDFTGGGANQTAISGTSVSAFDVPGFSYGGEQRALAYRYAMLRDWRLQYA